jgi:hypothetical protein
VNIQVCSVNIQVCSMNIQFCSMNIQAYTFSLSTFTKDFYHPFLTFRVYFSDTMAVDTGQDEERTRDPP